jgi:hypothetical protein
VKIDEIPEAEPGFISEDAEPVDIAHLKAAKFTSFTRASFLRRSGGNVYGRWATSFAQACVEPFQKFIPEGAIVSLSNSGSCPNCEAIIMAQHN